MSTSTQPKHWAYILYTVVVSAVCTALLDLVPLMITNWGYFEPGFADPVYKNYTASKTLSYDILAGHLVNKTWNPDDHIPNEPERVPLHTIGINVLLVALAIPVQYLWHIWLEETFPTRPQPANFEGGQKLTKLPVFAGGELSEQQEEEIVEYLIAKGKVERVSISYLNTRSKWLLDVLFGELPHIALTFVWWRMQQRQEDLPPLFWWYSLSHVVNVVKGGIWSMRSVAKLASMLYVPAEQRLMCIHGLGVVLMLLNHLFMIALKPMIIKTTAAQQFLSDMTDERWNESLARYLAANYKRLFEESDERHHRALQSCSRRVSQLAEKLQEAGLMGGSRRGRKRDEL